MPAAELWFGTIISAGTLCADSRCDGGTDLEPLTATYAARATESSTSVCEESRLVRSEVIQGRKLQSLDRKGA